MCSHIADQRDAGVAPPGRRLTIFGNLLICDDCFNSLGFDKFISLTDLPLEERFDDIRWEAFETAYQALERRGSLCVECLADRERAQGSDSSR
jgi:hypothetical protein